MQSACPGDGDSKPIPRCSGSFGMVRINKDTSILEKEKNVQPTRGQNSDL